MASLQTSSAEESEFQCHDRVVIPGDSEVKAFWSKKVIPDDTVSRCCREMLLWNSPVWSKRRRPRVPLAQCDVSVIFTGALSQNRCHRKRKASHISDICLPGKHKQEHTYCLPGAGETISSHTVTKSALIQMPGAYPQLPGEFGFNEDSSLRMKA